MKDEKDLTVQKMDQRGKPRTEKYPTGSMDVCL
jgi:hypothetical protein